MRRTTLCMVIGLALPNGANSFVLPPFSQSAAQTASVAVQRFMSDPAAGGQQPAPQQYFDQSGNPVPVWNTAVDPASGKAYWYNTVTGETSWNPPGPPPPPQAPPQQQQQQQQQAQTKPQTRSIIGSQGTRRNPDADRVVNKADVYLAMLKQDTHTRTMARHHGDIEGSNKVFEDPEIEKIKDMVVDNPYLEKSKELVEGTAEDELLPIAMLQTMEEEAEAAEVAAKAKSGPNYRERLAQMKNKNKGE